jgi:hypothetical protein
VAGIFSISFWISRLGPVHTTSPRRREGVGEKVGFSVFDWGPESKMGPGNLEMGPEMWALPRVVVRWHSVALGESEPRRVRGITRPLEGRWYNSRITIGRCFNMDPDTHSGGQAEQKTSRLDKIEQAAKIFATTMIPIIVAFGGWMIQTTIEHDKERAARVQQDQQSALDKDKISLEYVKIAKEILTSSQQSIPKELTTWSWKLLDGVSPVKFDKDALHRLIEREERIPAPTPSVAPTNFVSLAPEYAQMFKEMKLTGGKGELDSDVIKILENKTRYDAVEKSTGVPWYVVALIHKADGFNFSVVLHNGLDPLTKKTVNIPVGRGPFTTWEESARDAI